MINTQNNNLTHTEDVDKIYINKKKRFGYWIIK
jgi:hypothetical protein